jgi:hypothetical protein
MMLALAAAPCMLGQPFNASMFTTTSAAFDSYATTMKFADVNGDGYPDMCWAIPAQGQIYCALYSNGQFVAPSVWSTSFQSPPMQTCTSGTSGRGTCTMTSAYVDASVWDTIQFVDVNGDRKADVCGRTYFGFECYLSNGSDFTTPGPSSSDFRDAQDLRWRTDPSYYDTIRVVDINHDGFPDVCGRNSQGILCDLQIVDQGYNRFCNATDLLTGYPGCNLYGFDFGDNLGWNSSPAYWSTIQFADINGDHYLDVCGRGPAGIVCATFNPTPVLIELINNDTIGVTSLVFDQVAVWTPQFSDKYGWNQPQYYSTIKLVDIDGDHKADVCGRGGAGFYCAISNGSAFTGGFSLLADNFSDANGWNQIQHYEDIWIKDVNGGGAPDICGRGSQGIICQLQITPQAPFSAPSLWVNNFGDNYGWGNGTSYWGTVQMVPLTRPGWPYWAFCGHGSSGVWCTSFAPLYSSPGASL